jgi:hypothetical protein
LKKYITREEDVSDSKRYQAIARVRDRLEVLEEDVDALAEHPPNSSVNSETLFAKRMTEERQPCVRRFSLKQ